jgi:UrcA family protein
MKPLIVTIALAACATTGVLAHAEDASPGPRSVAVSFSDLDLAVPRDAAVLYERIRQAGKQVCESLSPARDPSLFGAHASCVRFAVSDAVARVDAPVLNGYAASRGMPVQSHSVTLARRQ